MPADGIPGCHSPRTETSARPVSKSSSRENYALPKDLHIGKDVALKQFSPDLNLRDSQTVSDDGDSVH